MSRRILSTLSPVTAVALEHELLQRNDVHLITARSIAELSALVQDGVELCLVEGLLPDGDALDALDVIRGNEELSRVPVVLVVTRDAPRSFGLDDGFDAILAIPDLDGTVNTVLGRLLGAVQRKGERRPASARVRDAAGTPLGRVVDLSRGGLAVRTRRAVTMGEVLALSIDLVTHTQPLAARARVVRHDGDVVALSLDEPSPELVAALADALSPLPPIGGLSFRPTPALGQAVASIGGSFVEGPALVALLSYLGDRAAGPCGLVLRDLVPFDEAGIDRWIALLERVSQPGPIELSASPVWFTTLAGRMPALLGRAPSRAMITSIRVPMRCQACHDELDDEVGWSAGDREAARAAITAAAASPCYICGGALALEEPLEVISAFLDL